MKPVTIAIPTHNRAATLRETLHSVFALEIPPQVAVDLIVVDNASIDDTAALADSELRNAPFAAQRVLETRLGESFSRNRAIAESRGELLLFIDDDAVAERSWAAAMIDAMEARQLDVACGLVLPRWSAPPDAWLGPRVYAKLAVHSRETLDRLPDEQVESLGNYFAANMGIRKESAGRFGGFREDLGVIGNNPISGADTDFFIRVLQRGGRIGFVRNAIVNHLIPRERMNRQYLRRKSFAYGVGSAVAKRPSHNSIDKLVRNLVRMASAAARGDSEGVMYHQLEIANFLGYWRGRMLHT